MTLSPADRFIDNITGLFSRSYAKGVLLLVMVVIAMVWANSPWYSSYEHFFHASFTIGFDRWALTQPLHTWINDGLMSVFFFTVGLEMKKEILEGELSMLKKASLPVVAAFGGMIVPALIFFYFNYGTAASSAWGIPMATDIAFTLGLISLVGSKVSGQLKIFLTALATVDDLGAILVIAFFLTPFINIPSLEVAGIYLGIMLLANYLGVRNMWFYLIVGVLGLWLALLLSGVHATLAGVLGAFAIPAKRKTTEKEYQDKLRNWIRDFDQSCKDPLSFLSNKQEKIINNIILESKNADTPLQRVKRQLDPVVNFFILPLFALANAGVRIEGDFLEMLTHPVSLGIIVGLVAGKFIGITLFSWILVKQRVSQLPRATSWNGMMGVGIMAGIGFTMSLFIAELALTDEVLLARAKVAILFASILSAILGLLWFYLVVKTTKSSKKIEV